MNPAQLLHEPILIRLGLQLRIPELLFLIRNDLLFSIQREGTKC